MSFVSRIRTAFQWRVRFWYVSYSGWRDDAPEFKINVVIQEDVWYWRFLEWLAWDNHLALCEWLHGCRIPKFIREWERAWDEDEPTEICKFEDWFGDEWCCLWHRYIESPILQWIWKHQYKFQKCVSLDLTKAEALERFKDDPAQLEWIWKDVQRNKEYDAEKAVEDASKDSK
jgi:hypothetical protein